MDEQKIELEKSGKDSKWSLKKKLKSVSTKSKIIIMVRITIILICTFGLINQTIELIDQYGIGQTVVNINYENKNFNTIPGITVCYPTALSMAAMAEKYPHLRPHFNKYIQTLNSISEEERKNLKFNHDHLQKLKDIYDTNFTMFIYEGQVYNQLKVPMKDIFDISIPFERGQSGKYTIEVITNGILSNGTLDQEVTDHNPIESLVFGHKYSWNKCFTFFSHLNPKWRDFPMDITKIYISVSYNESWFPRSELIDGIHLSLHSPDELPRHDVEYTAELKANRYLKLTYNRWKTELLGEGYQTRCRNYQLEEKPSYNRMRSECIKHCIHKKLNKCSECRIRQAFRGGDSDNCADCVPLTTLLWTRNDFGDNPMTRICENQMAPNWPEFKNKTDCVRQTSLKSESDCLSECRPKCVNRYYNYEVKSTTEDETTNMTEITIQHNQLPDQITRHLPEMTAIQFISNFGGLLGMWLGLSALAIFKYVLKFFFN